jgi:hypothetical protein
MFWIATGSSGDGSRDVSLDATSVMAILLVLDGRVLTTPEKTYDTEVQGTSVGGKIPYPSTSAGGGT